MITLDAPGPGRRPEGEPTHPPNKPDFPPPPPPPSPPTKRGHLPTGYSDPRAGSVTANAVARESVAPGAGAGPNSHPGAVSRGTCGEISPRGPLRGGATSLAQLISDLRLMLAAALARTQHQWDPASGPAQEDAPIGPAYVDRKLMNARADIRAALAELDELRVVVSLHDPERPTVPRPMPGFALPQPPAFDMSRPPNTGPTPTRPKPPTRPNQPRPIR